MSCWTAGHRPALEHGVLRCRDCGRRVLTRSEVPPWVTVAQVLVLAAVVRLALSVW